MLRTSCAVLVLAAFAPRAASHSHPPSRAVVAHAAFLPDASDFNLGDTIKGLPGMIKSNWQQFKRGTGQMWKNSKAASAVRKRARVEGGGYAYSELQLLRKSGEDTSKLVQAGFVWIFLPELFPALLYFYPRALPSTFESEVGRTKRHASLARMRTTAALELLGTLEEQAATRTSGKRGAAAARAVEVAEQTLRAGAPSKALAYVQGCAVVPAPGDKGHDELAKIQKRLAKRAARAASKRQAPDAGRVTGVGKVALLGISPPCLKAGCKLIGVSGPQPGPLRRAALGKHLEMLVEEDAVLLRTGTSGLTRAQLTEACLDRGFGGDALSDAQLRKLLDGWLKVVDARGTAAAAAGAPLEPHRLRLAAMASMAASSVRDERESMSVLPRLLYAH